MSGTAGNSARSGFVRSHVHGGRGGSRSLLVSCIMPTADRRRFVPQAIAAFLRQDYEPRELIIVDDGVDAVRDLVPEDERIRYLRSAQRQRLGTKRNAACRSALGDVIVHWDDDDWHATWRLSYQVGELLALEADICGLNRIWFYDPEHDRAWQYRYPGSRWLAGGTFCYRRRLWEQRPFPDVASGEDTRFVRAATSARLVNLDRDDFYVARIHDGNTSSRPRTEARWHRMDGSAARALVQAALLPPCDVVRGQASSD
jgi:glycosyltransferase involved in cell wall biosynthesis